MAIFAIIQQPGANAEKLQSAVEAAFPATMYPIGAGVWLVAGAGTAQDVANRIGVTPDGASGSAIVLEAASYFGRANPAVWSWIKSNWEARAVG